MVSLLYLEVEVHNVVCVHVLNIVTLLAKLYHRILAITLLEGLKLMMIWIVSKSDSFDFTHTRRKRLSLIHRNYCLFFKLFEIRRTRHLLKPRQANKISHGVCQYATHSSSTSAPMGKFATCTTARAGRFSFPKKPMYTSFIAP